MYMETQVAMAEPGENGTLTVHSATQSLDAVQSAVAAVLGLPFNQITVGECEHGVRRQTQIWYGDLSAKLG